MTVRCEIVGPDAARDGDPTRPDVYYTAGYGEAAATMDRGRWRMAHWDDAALVPYVVRRGGTSGFEAVSPYGYSGIHVDPRCSDRDLRRFWALTLDRWRAAGLAAVTLRFSPLDEETLARVGDLPGLELTRRGDTVTVPVGAGSPVTWSGLKGEARTAVRKARRLGLRAVIGPVHAVDLASGSPFRRLYETTMARVGSRPQYLFDDEHYRLLRGGLGENLLLVRVTDAEESVVAAALVLRHGRRSHYHLAGSLPEAGLSGANNLLVWTILEWSAENGCTLTHLGGGVRPDDGLFRFKRSFGGRRTTFWTGTVIPGQAARSSSVVPAVRSAVPATAPQPSGATR